MWWFYRKGPSGFSGASTAEEVTAGIDGRGLVAVITGTHLATSTSKLLRQREDLSDPPSNLGSGCSHGNLVT